MEKWKCKHCPFEGYPEDFKKAYSNGVRSRSSTCKKCNTKIAKQYKIDNRERENVLASERRRNKKLKAIARLGGKCSHCNSIFHPAVYDFHHVDPTTKEIGTGQLMNATEERLNKELDKCILLCANCHRIEHWNTE